jgi:SAM-dependent methyltransferase
LALEFSRENLEALRYADASFDAILCISVLEHTANPERVAREFWRCLAPGGRLVLTFDVSLDGSRDIPVAGASELLEVLAQCFQPASPFEDRELLDEQRLAGAEDLLRTASFRHSEPELLPWRMFSRATLDGLKRGRIGRPFFDLAVVGVVYEKRAG